jgi:hypothetical protein
MPMIAIDVDLGEAASEFGIPGLGPTGIVLTLSPFRLVGNHGHAGTVHRAVHPGNGRDLNDLPRKHSLALSTSDRFDFLADGL